MSVRARPRLLAITSGSPYASEAAFAQAEITELLAAGHDVLLVPLRRPRREANEDARRTGLDRVCVATPLLAPGVIVAALVELVRHPRRVLAATWSAVRGSRGRRNVAVNVLAIPKALWLARVVRRRRVDHIHAYWLSHTTTAAMIASQLTGVPYSASGYRWDIDVDNLLGHKFASASFLRCADEIGRACLLSHPHALPDKVVLIRTGVTLPDWSLVEARACAPSTWCCPGAFVEKKAQVMLVQALAAVLPEHPMVRLELFGEGPLEGRIRAEVARLGVGDAVDFRGHVSLAALQCHLRDARPVCVLPSIRTESGEMEGIPVSLVEAMANGAPVVSTPTGSIASLVVPGTGLLVTPGDPRALADAWRRLLTEEGLAAGLAQAARARVANEFDIRITSELLWACCTGGASAISMHVARGGRAS